MNADAPIPEDVPAPAQASASPAATSQPAATIERASGPIERASGPIEMAAMPAVERAGWSRHLALFAVVGALIALDLWSKAAVFEWFQDPAAELSRSERGHPRYELAGDWLGFMLNLNYGAAFGKASGMPWLLVGGRCVAAVFLTWLIVRTPKGQRVYLASLVLILSGALGNLYDNFFYKPVEGLPGMVEGRRFGPVRDFIDVYFSVWDWHFPTFNVADSCITVGAILLLVSGFFGTRSPRATS